MTRLQVKELRKAYHKAVKENADSFTIKGMTLIPGYAKYLLQYLTEVRHLKETDYFEMEAK